MRMKAASALAGILLLGGCATFEVGTTQDVDVATPGADSATCVLSNANGQWSVTTPATVRIGRSRGDLTVKCTKLGFLPAVAVVRASRSEYHTQIKDPSFLSLPEIAVDAASGAMWEYPGTVAVTMTPQ